MDSHSLKKETLDAFCRNAIKDQVGDMATLPDKLADHIRRIYREFIAAYLNMLRQKENKPDSWYPPNWSIDLELADEMRHFFSDYQHITRNFFILNAKLDRLAAIDKDRQPNLYQDVVEDILQ
jgi:hypothetical protein